jgi:hypothetical protein
MSLQLSPGTGRSHERRERRGHPATQPDTARFARARLITIGPDPQTVQARVTRGWAEPRRTIWTNLATLRGWPSSSILSLQVTLLLVGGVYVPGNRRGEIVHPFDPKGWTIGWTKSSLRYVVPAFAQWTNRRWPWAILRRHPLGLQAPGSVAGRARERPQVRQ